MSSSISLKTNRTQTNQTLQGTRHVPITLNRIPENHSFDNIAFQFCEILVLPLSLRMSFIYLNSVDILLTSHAAGSIYLRTLSEVMLSLCSMSAPNDILEVITLTRRAERS